MEIQRARPELFSIETQAGSKRQANPPRATAFNAAAWVGDGHPDLVPTTPRKTLYVTVAISKTAVGVTGKVQGHNKVDTEA